MTLSKHLRKLTVTFIALLVVISAFSIVGAQEENRYDGVDMITGTDPDATEVQGMATESSLEDVTANSPDFYGAVVTIEGTISEFVNSYTFVLGEDATLDNDQVLVINNASHPYRPEVMTGARVRITGRVLPSVQAVNDGVDSNYDSMFHDDMMTAVSGTDDMMDDTMMHSTNRYDVVQFAQRGYFADHYDDYTIVEIVNRDNLELVEQVNASG